MMLGFHGNARWIDQKCTPDVISVIADCILEYASDDNTVSFSSLDIWHSEYTINNVEAIFRKPNANLDSARNEYDKFFQQPMEMFSYAGVLKKERVGRRNYYKIQDIDILKYISYREMNALKFIELYNEKVLRDSGIYSYFENFFNNPSSDNYVLMKEVFSQFTINNTRINKQLECYRIFTKVLNPLSYMKGTFGTIRGRMSRDIINRSDLMYNRNNFRDIYADKPRNMTRREYLESLNIDQRPNSQYISYQADRAKRILKEFNNAYYDGKSEVDDAFNAGPALHMHHIFPVNEYEELKGFLENLIALTPTQHLVKAHPNGNTAYVDKAYQQICLLSKANHIKENLSWTENVIYSFENFIYVLTIGFDNEEYQEVENNDFEEIIRLINIEYIQRN